MVSYRNNARKAKTLHLEFEIKKSQYGGFGFLRKSQDYNLLFMSTVVFQTNNWSI
jgi:hypothetical protein